ncbi:MAG: 1-acyl-sn-glycerol-3-phosphate acyltransferase [Planctomycetaceae bacterium]|jgi:1-acyl-sn-glycerol-3-phosphate acyltransferase|nr:1-acyl-sn-glycerol-3-phosphate acyltransferase [Planctomycetaceae bacterium]
MRSLTWQKRLFYYLIRIPVNLFFRLFYRTRYFGYNNMPENGALLVVCNHQSHYDPPLIAAGLRRRMNFLARKTLFKFKPFAALIDLLDAIPLEINGIGFEGIKESLKRLRNGEVLLLFPEGARTFDGKMAPFREGALTLAQRSKAAILPAALDGCFSAFPRTHRFPFLFGRFRVIYGQPIYYDEFKDLTEPELREFVRRRIEELFGKIAGSAAGSSKRINA